MPDISEHCPYFDIFGGIHLEEFKASKSPPVHQCNDQQSLKGIFVMNMVLNKVMFEWIRMEGQFV